MLAKLRLLRDFLKEPKVISIVKLLVTIVLLCVYLASGDIDGLLRFLIGSL